jgi:hypothetical protein
VSIEIIGMVGTQEVSESRGTFGGPAIDAGFHESSSVGSQRLQQQAAERDVHDERLWMGVTKLTGPGGKLVLLLRVQAATPVGSEPTALSA